MSLLVGLGHVALLVAAGWWPMAALAHALAGRRWWSRASWALGLGAALVGVVAVALSWLGLAAQAALPGGLAALSLLGWLSTRGGLAPLPDEEPLPRPLAALLLVVALVGTGASVGLPFRSDGGKFWAPRARDLAQYGAMQAPALHDPARLAYHREYPLLVPVLLAPVFAASPQDATAGPKLVLAALQLALLGALASLLARQGRAGRRLLVAFATMPMLVSLDVRESAVAGGFVDGTLALFLLLLVAVVQRLRLRPRHDGDAGHADRRDVAVAILLGSALVATKLEGGIVLALLAASWLLVGPRRAPVWGVLAGVALLSLPTLFIQAEVIPDPSGFGLGRLADSTVLSARLLPVAAGLGERLLDITCFGLLPLVLVVAWCGAWSGARAAPRTRSLAWVSWMVAGATVFLLLSFLATNMQAMRHMHTSAHRLVWQWIPAVTWLLAVAGARGGRAQETSA